MPNLRTTLALLATRKPGKIIGPIASVLGVFYNAVFNLIFSVNQGGSLGIAIIIFTIIIKMILLPLTYKQQKSTYLAQKLQPQIKKIQEQYKDKKDRDSQQRMAFEISELQRANGVGMLSGCLPMLIQLPILYGLFYLFQQAYVYVDVIGNNYNAIANVLLNMPAGLRVTALTDAVVAHKLSLDVALQSDLITLLSSLSKADIAGILSKAGTYAATLQPLFAQKVSVEYFLGINLVTNPGLAFPGIIIPILSGASTWISSKMMSQNQEAQVQAGGDSSQSMMKSMNVIMPIIMGVFAIRMPAGLGIYWIVTNLMQLAQGMVLKKHFEKQDAEKAKEAV